MDLFKIIGNFKDYIKGFIETINIETPRYCFVIENLELIYHNSVIKTKVNYTPLGCYRPLKNFTDELNNELICRKFKPDHARMIIAINTLESTLNFKSEDQVKIYIAFVNSCMQKIEG